MPKKSDPPTGALTYIGDGAAIPDVPARDLESADLNTLADLWDKDPGIVAAELIASGLYTSNAPLPQKAAESEA